MLILKPNQVEPCQIKLVEQHQDLPGFIYLNRTFMPVIRKSYPQLGNAISAYKKWLLNENLLCFILEHSHAYSIWCLAPETAKVINKIEWFSNFQGSEGQNTTNRSNLKELSLISG